MAIQKIIQHTGYYPKESWNQQKGLPGIVTRINTFGYIPLVGTLTGGVRINQAIKNPENEPLAFRVAMAVRGLIEALGLGLLFLIPDLIVTCTRSRSQNSSEKATQTTSTLKKEY